MNEEIVPGEVWESVEHPSRKPHHGAPAGLCAVVGPNDSPESPGSYVMRQLSSGRTLYMHRGARVAGMWVRRCGAADGREVSKFVQWCGVEHARRSGDDPSVCDMLEQALYPEGIERAHGGAPEA